MVQTLSHFEMLAGLLDYPRQNYLEVVSNARELVLDRFPDAAAELEAFGKMLPSQDGGMDLQQLDEVQEIFTRSFDVQAVTTLGVGYVMFGDDYKRGELLVNLSREQKEVGIDCGSELPDHLPNVLRLLARWKDRELVEEFVEEILAPALVKMIAEFDDHRMEERNALYKKHYKTLIDSSQDRSVMFSRPLAALLKVVEGDFGPCKLEKPEEQNDFLRFLDRELEIESSEGRPAKSGRML